MKHLDNYPIEAIEYVADDDVPEDSIRLDFFYHKHFEKDKKVIVYIHDTAFHGKVVECHYYGGCSLVSVRIKESFKLRMTEQVLRIETSGLTSEEWVDKYAKEFPQE